MEKLRKTTSYFLILLAALALALLFCFLLTACSKEEPVVTTVPAPKTLGIPVIGMIYPGYSDQQYTYSYDHHQDLLMAMAITGHDSKTQLYIAENVAADDASLRDAVAMLTDYGANVIFSTDFGYSPYMLEIAEEYPHIVFCQVGGTERNGKNLVDYFGEIYKSYYVAGFSAGHRSLAEETNAIGFVSAYGMENPDAVSAINAFMLGVRYYNSEATVYLKILSDPYDENLEAMAAESLVLEQGCGILAQYTNSSATLTTAKYLGVPACGPYFYADDLAPDTVLETPHMNWFLFYWDAIKAAEKSTYAVDFGAQLGTDRYYPHGIGIGHGYMASLSEKSKAELPQNVKNMIDSFFEDMAPTDPEDPKYDEDYLFREEGLFSGRKREWYSDNGSKTTLADLLDNQGNVIVPAGGISLTTDQIRSMDYYLDGIVLLPDGR